jgi:SAM-dependent methyltransferase
MVSTAYTIEDQRRMSLARNYFAWQARLVKPYLGKRVIEAGCGIGNFTGELLDRELVVAIDSDSECVNALRERYRAEGNLRAMTMGAGSDDVAGLALLRPDSCVFMNALEHIEDDVAAVRGMADVIEPGGVVVIFAPAFEWLYGAIDRNLGHYRRYSRESVRRLAGESGLIIKKLRYVNIAGFFGWWMNARILRREKQSEGQIRVFDRLVVPVMSQVERVVAPPFGQSVLTVLAKVG